MILVTGASGFIGKALLKAYGPLAIGVQRSVTDKGMNIIQADITDAESVQYALERLSEYTFTHLIHAAAVTPWSKNADFSLNKQMAEQVVEMCNELKIPNLIFISGWNVYEYENSVVPFSEGSPVNPVDEYGRSKYEIECFLNEHLTNTEVLSLRTSSIYGVGQTSPGLIPNLVDAAFTTKKILLKSLRTKRDYLYIDDFVDAIRGITSMSRMPKQVLNIGSGKSMSVREVAEQIQKISQETFMLNVLIEHAPVLQESVPLDNILDIHKAKSLGLLTNTHSLKDGLTKFMKWKYDENIL